MFADAVQTTKAARARHVRQDVTDRDSMSSVAVGSPAYAAEFAEAGTDRLCVRFGALRHPRRVPRQILGSGPSRGASLNRERRADSGESHGSRDQGTDSRNSDLVRMAGCWDGHSGDPHIEPKGEARKGRGE